MINDRQSKFYALITALSGICAVVALCSFLSSIGIDGAVTKSAFTIIGLAVGGAITYLFTKGKQV